MRVGSRRHVIAPLCAAMAALGIVAGCGTSGSSDGELVALDFHGHFDFRIDDSDGSEHVFDIDTRTTINEDGQGKATANGKVHRFEVPATRLAQLKGVLADVNWDRLEADLGAGLNENGTFAITYEGRTVVVDAALEGEGAQSEAARSFYTIIAMVGALSQSPEQAAAERRQRERTRALTDCLERRNPGCLQDLP
jgi:hypothetical protein